MSAATQTININRRRERIFYTGMTVVFAVTVFAGFARTYYLRSHFVGSPLPGLLHLHGFLFSSWIVLLLTQTTLVAARRTDVHRRLGIAGGVLATLMVVVGTLTAITRARGFEVPPGTSSPLVFLTVPLGDMLVFAILVGAAFYFRRRKDAHKTLMLLATIAILPAAVARLPFDFIVQNGPLAFFGLPDLLIIPIVLFDIFARGRLQYATVLGGVLLVASHPLRLMLGNTQAWLTFATWLTDWVS